jgi:aminomethyltransferase
MKRTALYAQHVKHGARIVEFAGYELPIQYTGIRDEHRRVRTTVGVFDVSHMGEIEVRGEKALQLVQQITINDAASLAVGQVQYSCVMQTAEQWTITDAFIWWSMPQQG